MSLSKLEDIDLIKLFREDRYMKSLGAQKVHIEYYTDNIKTKSEVEKRVVYHKRTNGTYWCNWFAGGHREVQLRKDGSYYWRIDIRTLKGFSGDALTQKLKGLV